jgi:carbon dioxide concentrating mechanism protein CcmM
LGDVSLGEDVFVAPVASIRGDTGAPIRIGSGSNVQDGAVIHAADGRAFTVDNQRYAVYVGERVSLAHRCLVHGPVTIGDDAFIGFGAMVMNCTVGRGAVVMHMAYVTDVDIPPGRMVPTGTVVDSPDQARALPKVSPDLREMAERVVQNNRRYARDYADGTKR